MLALDRNIFVCRFRPVSRALLLPGSAPLLDLAEKAAHAMLACLALTQCGDLVSGYDEVQSELPRHPSMCD